MNRTPTVVCLGVHVLDTSVRPVTHVPDGQGALLVEQIVMSAAGTAGAAAAALARLGADVRSVGAVGTDAVGDLLLRLLGDEGVDTTLLRRTSEPTSASVLPVRPDGSHPTFHLVGANAAYTLDDIPWDAIAAAGHLHVGGPELLGGEAVARVLDFAREHGTTTSLDALAPGDSGLYPLFEQAVGHVDYLLPNDEQASAWTGIADPADAGRALLDTGARCVVLTTGADGAVVVDAQGATSVPAHDVEVVDTTGCGDAFSGGFVRGLLLGRDPVGAAALGCAVAALVAGGLGSTPGRYDLGAALALADGVHP